MVEYRIPRPRILRETRHRLSPLRMMTDEPVRMIRFGFLATAGSDAGALVIIFASGSGLEVFTGSLSGALATIFGSAAFAA
jgi:hypothetical protein